MWIVRSGPFVTACAALSHLDMALWLIRQSSPELATLVAKYLILDSRPSQSAYVIADHLAHAVPLVERFDRWVRQYLELKTSTHNVDAISGMVGTPMA